MTFLVKNKNRFFRETLFSPAISDSQNRSGARRSIKTILKKNVDHSFRTENKATKQRLMFRTAHQELSCLRGSVGPKLFNVMVLEADREIHTAYPRRVEDPPGEWQMGKKAIGLSAGIHNAKWYNLENKTYY